MSRLRKLLAWCRDDPRIAVCLTVLLVAVVTLVRDICFGTPANWWSFVGAVIVSVVFLWRTPPKRSTR